MVSIQEIIIANQLIRDAYEFAKKAHNGKKSPNGEPFLNHCLATAQTLASWNLDQPTIIAGLLHHTVANKDSDKIEDIKIKFGAEISDIVRGLLQITGLPYSGVESRADNLRKFILYLSKDIRVIFVKIAARLNTLKYLYAYPQPMQKSMALKTMDIYAPLASQIGMYKVSGDLEDLAFPYLYPEDYKWLMLNIKNRYEERELYLKEFKPILKKELDSQGLKIISIDSRAKHYFSLYQKLLRYNMDLDKIYDLIAVRIIVQDLSDCYTALGVIHKNWPPLSGRIKDYIASPKSNSYRSLHTSVRTPNNQITEIQIRTQEMHDQAELGLAAHFAYQNTKGTSAYNQRLAIAAETKELEFLTTLNQKPTKLSDIDFFKNIIFVLTPKGEVIDLASGATPIDFAYKIHSDLGNQAVGAKINNTMKTLSTQLQSGDLIEIMTDKKRGRPSEDWLTFVKTNHARSEIKSALRHAGHPLPKNFQKTEINLAIQDRPGFIKEITEALKLSKITINNLNLKPSQKKNKVQTLLITAPLITPTNIQKLNNKLKNLKEIKKIRFHNS